MIDDFNREALGIAVDFSLPSHRVIRALTQIMARRGKPLAIRCDNGPEYISATLLHWVSSQGIRIEHIQPGKLQQNAYVERFNRTVRYEWFVPVLLERLRRGAVVRHAVDMAVQP